MHAWDLGRLLVRCHDDRRRAEVCPCNDGHGVVFAWLSAVPIIRDAGRARTTGHSWGPVPGKRRLRGTGERPLRACVSFLYPRRAGRRACALASHASANAGGVTLAVIFPAPSASACAGGVRGLAAGPLDASKPNPPRSVGPQFERGEGPIRARPGGNGAKSLA